MGELKSLAKVLCLWGGLCVVIPTINASELTDLAEIRAHIQKVCPSDWEDDYSIIEFTGGDTIWDSNMMDKSLFVKYVADYLKDPDGSLLVDNFRDAHAIIYTCGGLKYRLFELQHAEATQIYNNFDALTLVDTDGDGANDAVDQCPDTVAQATVDQFGCSYAQQDEDNDGIANGGDQCLGTTAGVNVNVDGCQDSDFDGIADTDDAYPRQSANQCLF